MGAHANAGIVGPLGSSSFSLPTVERALSEMEGGSSLSADARRVPGARRVRNHPFSYHAKALTCLAGWTFSPSPFPVSRR